MNVMVKPAVMRRLMKEITELKMNPPEGIRVQTAEDNLLNLTGIIEGPEGTPYAGGYFRVQFGFTEEFPAAPPKCRMLTKIFHPNISNVGEICVNTLKRDWTPEHTLAHVLVTIKCLLIYPNAESALDEEAGRLLLEEYEAYCSRARLVTSVHARGRPAEFGPVPTAAAAPAASTASSSAAPVVAPTLSAPVTRSQSARIVSSENGPDGAAAKVVAVDVVASMKTRHASPAPLGTADGNANAGAGPDGTLGSGVPVLAAKAIKRAAAPGASGVEKRKKALKRL